MLRPSDWRQVRLLTLALYLAAIVFITGLGAVFLAWLVRLLSRLMGFLLPFLETPADFSDQLALITAVVAVLAFLITQFRHGWGRLRHLYQATYEWVMLRKLEQRGLRAWDDHTKPILWIWLQRLLRAED
jgi:hypothetical protein